MIQTKAIHTVKDTDKERVLCYVNDKQTYTPFSLDTDWEKAYKQASENVKKVFK